MMKQHKLLIERKNLKKKRSIFIAISKFEMISLVYSEYIKVTT